MQPQENEFASVQNGSASKWTTRNSDQRSLEVFVGNWQMEGQQFDSVFGGPAKVTAEESFEWLPGGMFLVHRLVGRLGAFRNGVHRSDRRRSHAGWLSRAHVLQRRPFPGLAAHRARRPLDDQRGLVVPDGSKRMVRCTTRFENGGTTRKGIWEVSADGKWERFWEVTARKKS